MLYSTRVVGLEQCTRLGERELSRELCVPGAAGPGHNATEDRPVSPDHHHSERYSESLDNVQASS